MDLTQGIVNGQDLCVDPYAQLRVNAGCTPPERDVLAAIFPLREAWRRLSLQRHL
jgi:hypothetical protein